MDGGGNPVVPEGSLSSLCCQNVTTGTLETRTYQWQSQYRMPELCTLQLRLPKGSCLPELGIVLQVLTSIRAPACNNALHTLSLAAMVILILLIAASVHCPAEISLKERVLFLSVRVSLLFAYDDGDLSLYDSLCSAGLICKGNLCVLVSRN